MMDQHLILGGVEKVLVISLYRDKLCPDGTLSWYADVTFFPKGKPEKWYTDQQCT